jgi:hypothetical protein
MLEAVVAVVIAHIPVLLVVQVVVEQEDLTVVMVLLEQLI